MAITPPNAEDIHLPVNLAHLEAWMDSEGIGFGPLEHVAQLAGGTQNILIRFDRSGRSFVLRRPPANPRPHSNRVMTREARLLSALSGSDVPHPGLIAACFDETVLGAVFYLMDLVAGYNATVALPPAARTDPSIRRKMGFELVNGLAALARLDPTERGLSDIGKLDGYLGRQVGRWQSELESYNQIAAWTGRASLGDVNVIEQWLQKYLPTRVWGGIVHGDYHVGNVIYGEDGALRAIVDWEMVTLGDPLLDFCRMLISWPIDDEAAPFTMRVTPISGFPSRSEMIACFAEGTGCALDALPWFETMACYKLGIILEGTHARAQAGLADTATGARLHESAIALLQYARRIVGRN